MQTCGAYFYKRKKAFLEDKKNEQRFSFSKVLHQIQGKNSKYVKRYFKIDTAGGRLMYAEKLEDIDNKPQFQVKFGDVKDV